MNEEWIECEYELPMLSDDTPVDVMFRDNDTDVTGIVFCEWDWQVLGRDCDIVAYRLHGDAKNNDSTYREKWEWLCSKLKIEDICYMEQDAYLVFPDKIFFQFNELPSVETLLSRMMKAEHDNI